MRAAFINARYDGDESFDHVVCNAIVWVILNTNAQNFRLGSGKAPTADFVFEVEHHHEVALIANIFRDSRWTVFNTGSGPKP